MDHLPKVEEPYHRELQIPLFVKKGQEYDGVGLEDFLSFPSKQGLNLERLKFGDFGERTFEDVISCIQAWGYFGMLQEVLRVGNVNMRFDFSGGEETEDLIRFWYDHEEVVDRETKNVHAETVYKITWAVRDLIWGITHQEFRGGSVSTSTDILDEDEESMKLSSIVKDLSHEIGMIVTDKYYDRNPNFYTAEKGWEDEEFKIGEVNWKVGRTGSKAHQLMLSIVVLGETLTNAASVIYEGFNTYKWPLCPMVSFLMELVGWCPFQISQLSTRCTNSHLYYLSFFNQQQFSNNHRRCCKDFCLAYQINEEIYETRHVTADCNCAFISFAELADVFTWIEQGGTALVKRKVKDTGEGIQKIWRLVPSHVDGTVARYVCISHVWGDGMGNPRQNSLPECQLEKLQDAVNGLHESDEDFPFWIDTVCIPLQQPFRKQSIRSMAKIYQKAESVLVIDNTLTNVSTQTSIEEIMSRIEVSGWMGRLWTLSEGVAASKLYFKLRQHAVVVEHLQYDYRLKRLRADVERFRELSADRKNPMFGLLARQLRGMESMSPSTMTRTELANLEFNEIYFSVSTRLVQMRLPKRIAEEYWTDDSRFYWILSMLTSRNTSKAEDEAICIAQLLDMDVQPMLEMDPETRMLSLFLRYSHLIPSGIIFGKRPRAQRMGFRWAPLSLMQSDFSLSGKAERVTEDGIYAYYCALSFRPFTFMFLCTHFGLIDCSSGTRYLVDVHGIAENEMLHVKETMHIIIECPLGQKDEIKGLLVNVLGEENGSTFAEIVRPVVIRDLGARKNLPDHECAAVDPVVPNRLWCLG
ncbi:hypothetical protein IFM46972_03445 [Aspergillus udagawae]|uniref:Heterokaryon incompatibility domain-containing protein n=1 Tax=Aspergillus udagawae TaxID=91492 RepID=A0A8H3RM48_9EURO|nr:hypothetical protein IFM46972_03445 [Aspergillus udagawae]